MRPAVPLIALASLFLAACATSLDNPAPRRTGTSRTWGRIIRADGMRLRWSYTIVLREKAGSAGSFRVFGSSMG